MSSCSEEAESAMGETENTPAGQAGNSASQRRDTGLNASWYLRLALALLISIIAIHALANTASAEADCYSKNPGKTALEQPADCFTNNPGKTALEQLCFCATGRITDPSCPSGQLIPPPPPPGDYSGGALTLTVYVHENSASGPVIAGAQVSGQDAAGNSFSQVTNSSGYVTITGVPGTTWSFTASKTGYQTNSWSQSIITTDTKHAYLVKQTGDATVSPGAFNFALSVTPSSLTASAGQKEGATYKISLQTLMGQTDDLVWLEASGIPPNSATWLGPCIGCRVPYESRLEVRPASNTPPGRYDITITAKTLPRGSGDRGIIHSQRVTLIVEERPTFKISVTPFSPQETAEGSIQEAGWTFNVVWKGKPEPVRLIAEENIDIVTDPPGFEKLRRDSLRGQWVGLRNITLGQATEESLRLSINFDRLPNDIGHKYPISYVQITLKAVRSDGTTEFIPLPPLKVLSCNADWSAALPANRLLENELNLGLTPEGSRLVLPPDPNFKGRDVERRPFDEEARSPILVYRPSAPQIGSWVKVGPIFPIYPNELRWEWSNPKGEVVKNFKKSLPPQPNRCAYWTSYSEMDTLDKELWVPGLWKVKVFLDEELKVTLLFRIEALPQPTPTPPPPALTPAPQTRAFVPATPPPLLKEKKAGGFSCAPPSQAYHGPNSATEQSGRSVIVLSFLVVAASLTFLSLQHWR